MNTKRIKNIDGLRALGWIGVFLGHFKATFFPNQIWFTDHIPFIRVLYAGNIYVRIFFVISGFVLALKYYGQICYDAEYKSIIKRYFRLMPSILVVEFFAYFFMAVGAYHNIEAGEILGSSGFLEEFNNFNPSFLGFLKESLIDTFIFGSNSYIGPLWTMKYEFLGYLLIVCSLVICKKKSIRVLFYMAFLCVFNGYYNYLIIGMIICDLYLHNKIINRWFKNKWMPPFSVILGYMSISILQPVNDSSKICRTLAAMGIILLFLGVLYGSKGINALLTNSVMQYFGNISFQGYILHWPIIEVISCGIVVYLYKRDLWSESFMLKCGIFCFTFAVVIGLATLLKRLIEPLGERISCFVIPLLGR